MNNDKKIRITIFHCINAFKQAIDPVFDGCEIKYIEMPCSSMTKDVYLLRAFEAGADIVLIFVCPEDSCHYAQGSIRARKRVDWVRGLLDEIGMDGKRQLAIYNINAGDDKVLKEIIKNTIKEFKEIKEES